MLFGSRSLSVPNVTLLVWVSGVLELLGITLVVAGVRADRLSARELAAELQKMDETGARDPLLALSPRVGADWAMRLHRWHLDATSLPSRQVSSVRLGVLHS